MVALALLLAYLSISASDAGVASKDQGKSDSSEVEYLLHKYNFIETPRRGYFAPFFETPANTSDLPEPFNSDDVRKYGAVRLHMQDYNHPSVAFHKAKPTLVITFMRGSPTIFYYIDRESGELRKSVLGKGRDSESILVIPPDTWFAATLRLRIPSSFAFLASFAIPGSIRSDSEMASRDQLMHDYPQHAEAIRYFTEP